MAELILKNDSYGKMEKHALATFPDECCGFMYGGINENDIIVESVSVVENSHPDFKARRFLITPEDYMKAEKYADDSGLSLVGVYHSHPNHPAIPSETDRFAAMPGFAYIIYSVIDGEPADVTAWELIEDRSRFRAIKIVNNEESSLI